VVCTVQIQSVIFSCPVLFTALHIRVKYDCTVHGCQISCHMVVMYYHVVMYYPRGPNPESCSLLVGLAMAVQ